MSMGLTFLEEVLQKNIGACGRKLILQKAWGWSQTEGSFVSFILAFLVAKTGLLSSDRTISKSSEDMGRPREPARGFR